MFSFSTRTVVRGQETMKGKFVWCAVLLSVPVVEAQPQNEGLFLSDAGVEQHGPKFYQLMKRLEDGDFVQSAQQGIEVAGGEVQRTYYQITTSGEAAWRVTREFYASRMKARRVLGE